MIPGEVKRWLDDKGFGAVLSQQPVGGGCISNGNLVQTASGERFFLKQNRGVPADFFACEAHGLQALAAPDGPHVPRVHLVGAEFILMEDLQSAAPVQDYWEQFGRQLALLHTRHTAERYGFDRDNYIGSTPQPNTWEQDGFVFFGERRLLFQARLAQQRGLLEAGRVRQVEALVKRLPELVPSQPASLLHGDLWSGNAVTDNRGRPALIDPAAYYGWSEAELGMTRLFGGFPASFYQAYQEINPRPPGLEERLPLYNLYHLLNHLNLFGTGYYGQVVSLLGRFTG